MKMVKNGIKFITLAIILSIAFGLLSSAYASDNQAYIEIQKKGTIILDAYLWFGYAISLGMVVFIGIKYMVSAADARANMKSALVGWFIGAAIVFMSTTIIGLILKTVNRNNDSVEGMANNLVEAGYGVAGDIDRYVNGK